MDHVSTKSYQFNDRDFEVQWYSGTGNGGQNKNKVQASCRLIHLETGLTQTAQTRSRENSYKFAKERMIEALKKRQEEQQHTVLAAVRKSQVGSGMRSDKIRTYRFQDNVCVDHQTGKKVSVSKIMSGFFDLVW